MQSRHNTRMLTRTGTRLRCLLSSARPHSLVSTYPQGNSLTSASRCLPREPNTWQDAPLRHRQKGPLSTINSVPSMAALHAQYLSCAAGSREL